MRREEKARRARRKENNRGVGGYITAIVSLGIATLVLASVLTFTFLMPSASDNMLEFGYKKDFVSAVEQVNNMDVNLSKILATGDTSAMQKYLVDTAINSELAENDIQALPLHDESKFYTTKLINQIGDFAKYLNNKLASGETPNSSDMQTLRALKNSNAKLKNALNQMSSQMTADFRFSSMLDGGNGNYVIKGFNDLENLSVEYPELIYDGPFSDGQEDREIKGLSGEEITSEMARDIFTQIFNDYSLEEVQSVGEATGAINCYNVQAMVNGDILFAQISKVGGKLITFSYAGSCESVDIDDERAVDVGQSFLNDLGITSVKPVWINLSNNVYTINFAGEQGGVILYGDLIKVRVCAKTSMVIGIEAKSYFTNHVERDILRPTLTPNQCMEKLNKDVEVQDYRLALVPVGQSSERLCYEFVGLCGEQTYYIYIDAINGKQVQMFEVIETENQGQVLI